MADFFFPWSTNTRNNNLPTMSFIIFQDLFLNTQKHDFIRVYIWWRSTAIYIHFSLWHPKCNMGTFINQIFKHARRAFLWICLSSMLFGFLPWIRCLLLTDNKWQWNFILNFLLGHILCTQHDFKFSIRSYFMYTTWYRRNGR